MVDHRVIPSCLLRRLKIVVVLGFPIYGENYDVRGVGDFIQKQSFIWANVKDLLQ